MQQANKIFIFVALFGMFIAVPATSRTKRAVPILCTVKHEDPLFDATLKSELDKSTKIVEYELKFKNYSPDFWNAIGGKYWFKPTRWYYSSADRAERLLLLFQYYYGLMRPIIQIGVTQINVHLVVEPPGCLLTLSSDQLQFLLHNLVLENFDLTVNSTEGLSATESKHSCTMRIFDENGWGKLVYDCCTRLENGDLDCEIVADDNWVWVLRGFIISLAILIFLFFPIFIPRRYKRSIFNYYPPTGLAFNILKTENPPKKVTKTQVVNIERIKRLTGLYQEVKDMPNNTVFNIKVRKMEFFVSYDRLLAENEAPVGMLRLLFNALIRCKIRHSDPLEVCCNTSVLGEYSCGRGPRWYRLLQLARTLLVFTAFVLPAVPLMYSLCDDQLESRQAAQVIRELGLKQSYNFDVGNIWGKVIVAVLSCTYLIHVIVVIIDEAMDQSLGKLYNDLIEASCADVALSERIKSLGRLVKYIFLPVQKFGFYIIPFWLVILLLSPVALCLYVVFTAPTLKLFYHVFSLVKNWVQRSRTDNVSYRESRFDLAERITFSLTLISVFVMLAIDFDFLLQLIAVFVVNMLINVKLTMRVLPVVILVLFYIKDTFNGVSSMYYSYHQTILKQVQSLESDDIKQEATKDISEQESKIFQICGNLEQTDESNKETLPMKMKARKFRLKNNRLRMNTQSLILFLDNDDTPYVSKKFFYHTTDIECPGVPGYVEEAVLRAFFDFLKIVLFLAFILIVVMAYGDTQYLSPSGQFFATFISGLIPLFLRKFFLKVRAAPSLDTSSLRFQTHFVQRLDSFKQSWPINDIVVDSVSQTALDTQAIKTKANGLVISKWNMNANSKSQLDASSADLVIDISSRTQRTEQTDDEAECCFCFCFNCKCFSGSVSDYP